MFFFSFSFLAVRGHHCWAQAFSSCSEQELLFAGIHGLMPVLFSCCRAQAQWLQHVGWAVVCTGPSCPSACGIFPEQGLNPCPPHWQAESQPQTTREAPVLHCSSEAQTMSRKKLDHDGTGYCVEGDLKLQERS